jgi:hypothetical protein
MAIGGKSLLEWEQEWNGVVAASEGLSNSQNSKMMIAE